MFFQIFYFIYIYSEIMKSTFEMAIAWSEWPEQLKWKSIIILIYYISKHHTLGNTLHEDDTAH